MSSRRFMISSRCIDNGTAILGEEHFRHIVRVLRLAEGSPVTLVDDAGAVHEGTIERIGEGQVFVAIRSSAPAGTATETAPAITVCQALPKGEKIDLILQKGTELGVQGFRLFAGRRSVVRLKDDQVPGKLARWERIVTEAARQCGRSTVPTVQWFPTALAAADSSRHDLRLLLNEDERTTRLNAALADAAPHGSIAVAIGPEGGFDPDEIGHFGDSGFRSISLGRRILRTETAAIAIVAILQYIHGEI